MQVKRSKNSRHRGSNSHSWGHKKKHRGKGHIGGVGLAGSGRGGDSKKSAILSRAKSILNQISAQRGVKVSTLRGKYFGKKGFTSVRKRKEKVLSISFIENNYDSLVKKEMIVEGVFDSTKFGYDKILGRGNFTRKIKIVCKDISDGAKTKIEESGGSVEVLRVKNSSKN